MSKLSFLFWNTGKKDVSSEIAQLATHEKIDILLLAESICHPAELMIKLNTGREGAFDLAPCNSKGIQIFTRFDPTFFRPVMESPRYSIRSLTLPGRRKVLFAIAHLRSKRNFSDDSQGQYLIDLARVIREIETDQGHTCTVLVGDLNVSPFEKQVVAIQGLHAVASRAVASASRRRFESRWRPFFYNPMWGLFGDRNTLPPGTHYYFNGDPISYYWYMLDQVLIRPALFDAFDSRDLTIVTKAGEIPLLSREGKPSLSDHLPLRFRLRL